MLGGQAFWKILSPFSYLSEGERPFLIFFGCNDMDGWPACGIETSPQPGDPLAQYYLKRDDVIAGVRVAERNPCHPEYIP